MSQYGVFTLTSPDILQENQRKLTSKTISTYLPEWITVHEKLQNAKDAIQKSSVTNGRITVVLDLTTQEVRVEDNGKGFPHDVKYLGLGGTDKDTDPDGQHLGGSQGVGLKAVLFSSSYFEVQSVVNGVLWTCNISDAYRYMERTEGPLNVEDPCQAPRGRHQGTIVTCRFPEPRVSRLIEKILDECYPSVKDDFAEDSLGKLKLAVEFYFRRYSYVGDLNVFQGLPGSKPVEVEVLIKMDPHSQDPVSQRLAAITAGAQEIAVKFSSSHWNVREAVQMRVRSGVPRARILDVQIPDGGDIGPRNQTYLYVRTLKTPEEFRSLLVNSRSRGRLSPDIYDNLINNYIRGITIVVGSAATIDKYLMERPQQFIAANGVPSAQTIAIPTQAGSLPYLRAIHFIINVDAKLNYGKQSIPNSWLLGRINAFFQDAYRMTLRNLAQCMVGNIVEDEPEFGRDRVGQETDAEILSRGQLPLPELSIKREPNSENTTIGLFYELIGRGYLAGYETYALTPKNIYDGKMVLYLPGDTPPRVSSDSHLKNMEFKLKLSVLVEELEEQSKRLTDVSLVVVWEDDFDNQEGHIEVIGIDHTVHRYAQLDGVTKCLKDHRSGREVQMLVLKELIQRLASRP